MSVILNCVSLSSLAHLVSFALWMWSAVLIRRVNRMSSLEVLYNYELNHIKKSSDAIVCCLHHVLTAHSYKCIANGEQVGYSFMFSPYTSINVLLSVNMWTISVLIFHFRYYCRRTRFTVLAMLWQLVGLKWFTVIYRARPPSKTWW